jgi:hypothetical protein
VSAFDSKAEAPSHQHHRRYFLRKRITNCRLKKKERCIEIQNGFQRPCYSHQRYLFPHSPRERETHVACVVIRFRTSLLSPCYLLPQNYYFSSSIFILFFSFIRLEIVIFVLSYSNSIFPKDEGIQQSNCCYSRCQRSAYPGPGSLKQSTVTTCVLLSAFPTFIPCARGILAC